MSVEHLEEAGVAHLHQLLRRDGEAEVGMVDVREHRLAGALALLKHGRDVVGQDCHNTVATERLDRLTEVVRVHVDRGGLPAVRDLLALQDEEAVGLLELAAILGQELEAHLGLVVLARARLDPILRPAGRVFREGLLRALVGSHVHPLVGGVERVVFGEREEMVAVGLVELGDHLREVVAIAPKRVGVEVAAPPASGVSRRGGEHHAGQGQCEEEGTKILHASARLLPTLAVPERGN